jgi:hypothetical protein
VAPAVLRQDQNGMRGLMLQRSSRPWGAIDCRQPRYPWKISKDRRFCDPASRQVCLCQLSARRPRFTYPSWTDTVRVFCVVPLFPESSQTCVVRAKYRHTHDRNKCEFVAHRRHNSSSVCGAGNELKSFQRRAVEISSTPVRLMSHALLTVTARKMLEVLDAWCCLRGGFANRAAVAAADVCAE